MSTRLIGSDFKRVLHYYNTRVTFYFIRLAANAARFRRKHKREIDIVHGHITGVCINNNVRVVVACYWLGKENSSFNSVSGVLTRVCVVCVCAVCVCADVISATGRGCFEFRSAARIRRKRIWKGKKVGTYAKRVETLVSKFS